MLLLFSFVMGEALAVKKWFILLLNELNAAGEEVEDSTSAVLEGGDGR